MSTKHTLDDDDDRGRRVRQAVSQEPVVPTSYQHALQIAPLYMTCYDKTHFQPDYAVRPTTDDPVFIDEWFRDLHVHTAGHPGYEDALATAAANHGRVSPIIAFIFVKHFPHLVAHHAALADVYGCGIPPAACIPYRDTLVTTLERIIAAGDIAHNPRLRVIVAFTSNTLSALSDEHPYLSATGIHLAGICSLHPTLPPIFGTPAYRALDPVYMHTIIRIMPAHLRTAFIAYVVQHIHGLAWLTHIYTHHPNIIDALYAP